MLGDLDAPAGRHLAAMGLARPGQFAELDLLAAQRLGAAGLSFLVHPTLDESDMRDTCAAVAKVMRAAART